MKAALLRRPPGRRRSSGQSLAEFALVFPILMVMLGGIIQFGIIFWGQNTLTQIARDTGRWASTQIVCPTSANTLATANAIAGQSSLIGYTSWGPSNVQVSLSGVSVSGDLECTGGIRHRHPQSPCTGLLSVHSRQRGSQYVSAIPDGAKACDGP